MRIYRLENVIQPYAWGSKTAIADLLGLSGPRNQPQAELWMGTHPKGHSKVIVDDHRVPLQQLIDHRPVDILGHDAVSRFGKSLPYLFKVLAAAQPLSIQAHPSKEEAMVGFARENREGKAMDAPDRNYRDANHKPEIICALTPFWALNGFRSVAEAADLLSPVCPRELADELRTLKKCRGEVIKAFFKRMMTLSVDECRSAGEQVLAKAKRLEDRSPVYGWVLKLARAYPSDVGVLAPALLNLVRLDPGQAMYLPAGQLHAYLDGVGVELMANSDNVLRGGLTPKHVDVPELLRVVRFVESSIDLLTAAAIRPAEGRYAIPAEEFSLSVIQTAHNQSYVAPAERSVEILLCVAGEGRLGCSPQEDLAVKRGDSFLIPAGMPAYTIHGHLTLYKAAVPLAHQ